MPYFAMSGSAANLDSDGQKKNNMKVRKIILLKINCLGLNVSYLLMSN